MAVVSKILVEKIDISLIKITPENISGETEFTDNFFSKIDEIERRDGKVIYPLIYR